MAQMARVPNGDCRDHEYIRVLSNAIRDEPMPDTLAAAVAPLHAVGIDVHALANGQDGIERTRLQSGVKSLGLSGLEGEERNEPT